MTRSSEFCLLAFTMGSEVGAGIRRSQPIALSLLLWIVDTWSLLVPRPLFPTCYNELAGRRSLGVERLWQHHRLGNHDGNNTSIAAPTAAAPRRRQKKNKYAKFSKVAETTIDPLEALLQESERLNRELMEEQQREEEQKKRSRPQPEIKPLPKLEFPDTQTIDPYDPQTFGYVELGAVSGAHGVHGWLKIKSSTGVTSIDDAAQNRLCSPGVRHIKPANKRAPRPVVLVQGRHRHADEYLVQLDDIHDRDEAQKLRGATLYIREEQQREHEEDTASEFGEHEPEEYYVQDLVGLEVFLVEHQNGSKKTRRTGNNDGSKKFVGTVGGVVFADELCSIPGLGHDYLELVLPRGIGGTASWKDEMVLVPLVPQIVPIVDLVGGEIYLDPPSGLLDLTYVRAENARIKGFLPSSGETG